MTAVDSTRENPAETALDCSRRSSGSGPPAMEQHVTEYVDAKKNVDATRITKLRVRQLETLQVLPSPSEGDRVKRQVRGYLGENYRLNLVNSAN